MPSQPDWTKAEVAREKFAAYSMDPANQNSRGKWKAFEALGYRVHDAAARLEDADAVIGQLRATLPPDPPPPIVRFTQYGDRYETAHPIQGLNGRCGTLFAVWQVADGSPGPRLVTNWLEVHKP
jgi:hypothetical protein